METRGKDLLQDFKLNIASICMSIKPNLKAELPD